MNTISGQKPVSAKPDPKERYLKERQAISSFVSACEHLQNTLVTTYGWTYDQIGEELQRCAIARESTDILVSVIDTLTKSVKGNLIKHEPKVEA
jgi:hypothetical protein